MALGIHSFYAYPLHHRHRKEDFYLGSFLGDHWNDDVFDAKMKKIERKLVEKFGYGRFQWHWSPGRVKQIKTLTSEQKYKRMATKSYNEHKKKVEQIINANSMFVDDFIAEQSKILYARIEQLKIRYKQ